MEVVEVQKDKEWILYPEGQKSIRLVIDRRMRPISRWGGLLKAGAISSARKREIRVAPTGVSQTAVGHEVGHIILGHGEEEGEGKLIPIGPDFIKEELEAEYWAYSMGFPKRKYKIEDLRYLALEIGMTGKQFDRIHKEVKRRLKER